MGDFYIEREGGVGFSYIERVKVVNFFLQLFWSKAICEYFPVCCQLLARILVDLLKQTFKRALQDHSSLPRLMQIQSRADLLLHPHWTTKKNDYRFPTTVNFSLWISVPFRIAHVKCTAMDSCSLSKYICVYSMCRLPWLSQYKPITWVQEKGENRNEHSMPP